MSAPCTELRPSVPRLLAGAWVLLLLVGCSCAAPEADGTGGSPEGGGGGPPPAVDSPPLPVDASRKLCDGSPSLRLAVQGMAGDLLPNGEAVWFENGAHFLFVDGTCRYWVQLHPAQGLRVGQLDREQEEVLTRSLLYRSWAALAGTWPGPAGTYDAGSYVFWDAQYTVTCDSTCNTPQTPKALRELVVGGYVDSMLQSLWQQGEKLQEGSMRLVVVPGVVSYQDPFDWPLAQSVESFASEPSAQVEYGESRLVVDAADVLELRELRAHYDASPAPQSTSGKIPLLGAGGVIYGLFLRDTLPFEDGKGLVRPPSR
jgi:hypothetical protein